MDTQIIPIVAPGLNDSNYGQSIEEQFENINHNFNRIASLPFLQGKEGDSLGTENILLSDSKEGVGIYWEGDQTEITHRSLYLAIRSAILSDISEKDSDSGLSIIQGMDWSDNMPDSYITIIYSIKNEKKVMVSSLLYIFKDKRFTNIKITDQDSVNDYIGAIDTSCVVCYQSGQGFVKSNVIPRIYYDTNIQDFCWYLNGSKTGIIATGPQGPAGTKGNTHIVLINDDDQLKGSNQYPINSVLKYVFRDGVWMTEFIPKSEIDISSYFSTGDAAIVFKENDSEIRYWISQIRVEPQDVYVDIVESLSIQGIQSILGFVESMKMIGTDAGKSIGLNGLFIPIQKRQWEGDDDKFPAHIITPTNDSNIIIGPIGDALSPNTNHLEDDDSNNIIFRNNTLDLYYHTHVKGDLSTEGNLNVKGDTIIYNLNWEDEGYPDMESAYDVVGYDRFYKNVHQLNKLSEFLFVAQIEGDKQEIEVDLHKNIIINNSEVYTDADFKINMGKLSKDFIPPIFIPYYNPLQESNYVKNNSQTFIIEYNIINYRKSSISVQISEQQSITLKAGELGRLIIKLSGAKCEGKLKEYGGWAVVSSFSSSPDDNLLLK